MIDLSNAVRRHGLNLVTIALLLAGAIACKVLALPTWLLVLCIIALVFAVVALLGDLGVFGGADTD